MYRNRSMGRVCPFVSSVECCIDVRLYICDDVKFEVSATGLFRRPVETYLNTVLASGGDNLSTVELKRSDRVIELDRLEYATSAQVPYLHYRADNMFRSQLASSIGNVTYPDGLVQASADNMHLVEL